MSSPDEAPVRRCVCKRFTFAELKQIAEQRQITDFETLQILTDCSSDCGLCVPYVKAMLQTGRTAFQVNDPAIKEFLSD